MTTKPHKDAHLFPGVPDDLIHDFAAVRKAKRAPITATAVKGIVREAEKAGMTLEQALTMCVEMNWQGFRAEWATNSTKATGRKGQMHGAIGEQDFRAGVGPDGSF